MARPKKTPEELRSELLGVRLTMAERIEIEYHARMLGDQPRRIHAPPHPRASPARQPRRAAAAGHPFLRLLRVGVNLNQWTHAINAGRIPPIDELEGVIYRIKSMLDETYGPDDHGGRNQL